MDGSRGEAIVDIVIEACELVSDRDAWCCCGVVNGPWQNWIYLDVDSELGGRDCN